MPVECENLECGQLYCSHCLNQKLSDNNLSLEEKKCEVCQKISGGYRQPSAIVLKMLRNYVVKCSVCSKPFSLQQLNAHEVICQQSVCSNELCGANLGEENLVLDLEDSLERVI